MHISINFDQKLINWNKNNQPHSSTEEFSVRQFGGWTHLCMINLQTDEISFLLTLLLLRVPVIPLAGEKFMALSPMPPISQIFNTFYLF